MVLDVRDRLLPSQCSARGEAGPERGEDDRMVAPRAGRHARQEPGRAGGAACRAVAGCRRLNALEHSLKQQISLGPGQVSGHETGLHALGG